MEHPPPMRESYSGLLVAGAGWTQSGKKYGEIYASRRIGLYMHSGLAASSEDHDKDVPSQLTKDQVGKLSNHLTNLGIQESMTRG